MKWRSFQPIFWCVCALLLTACGDVDYYAQCATGHLEIMSRTRPIEHVINDPQVAETERKQLAMALEIRDYASSELALPENNSYRHYADIGRQYVVWNVVATPEFSLKPKEWCFPVAGCVAYRGYFDQQAAGKLAAELRSEGYDVDVYGVQAYSTLNWFDDPVLNTFLRGAEARLAALLFHELAHQRLYLPGDSSFNEAFAKTVELEGLQRWLKAKAKHGEWQQQRQREAQQETFSQFLGSVRHRLQELYDQPMPEETRRMEKRLLLEQAQLDYQGISANWTKRAGTDSWMAKGLNNARLASVATYRELVPAFQSLLNHHNGDLNEFYLAVTQLSKLPTLERQVKLRSYEQKDVQARNQFVAPIH